MYLRPFVSKVFYAVLLAPLRPKQSAFVLLRSALFQKGSYRARALSMVNFLDSMMSGIASKLSHWMYRNNRFPWAPVDSELIAFGTGAAVFKLNWKSGDKVLRIYRKSLGKPSFGLLEMAEHYKTNYETVLSWYGNLVLPMEFLVLQGLPLIGPIAASLQPHIHGQIQDLFEDFSDDELLRLFEENDHVREQFIVFAKQTIRQVGERKRCYDFLGRENLMLVKQEGNYRLCIADVGIFEFNILSSQKVAQIDHRMNKLDSLYELAKRIRQTKSVT